eukprot:Seg7393.1 transcript_id=Seg7393.1/GoldUCD/mRNA.D3Y31 product="hypothetical protein" pseudo=true protein_id=Seg7393.1/GoldUCD/D3Y31
MELGRDRRRRGGGKNKGGGRTMELGMVNRACKKVEQGKGMGDCQKGKRKRDRKRERKGRKKGRRRRGTGKRAIRDKSGEVKAG